MATVYWQGAADAVAQVTTIQVTAFDAATTYTVTIGGVAVSVAGTTDVNGTASALQAALAASTHPYFTAVTWTVSTDTVTGTAAVAGAPFVASSSVASGTGTIGAATDTTSNAGPNDWSTADNWSGGSVPVASDDVVFRDNGVNVCWGLDQSAVDLASLTIEQTYTGKIGLNRNSFSTTADGETASDPVKPEYREDYLVIGWTTCNIGEHVGPGSPGGSTRIKLDNDKAGASTTVIHDTANTASETGLPCVRLLASNASADVFVRSATGGVGIAIDDPTETATIGDLVVSDDTESSKVYIGSGTTITSWAQTGGNNILQAAATVTSVDVDGGTLTIEGDMTVTTVNANEGTVYANHIKTAGNAITTANINGGTLDGTQSGAARTWATVNLDDGTLVADDAVVTITTLDQPAGIVTLTAA